MRRSLILLMSLCLCAAVLAVVGCGGGGDKSASPEQVVEKFVKAALAGDADTAYSLITEGSKGEVENKEDLVEGVSEGVSEHSVGKSSISGDTARVQTSLTLKDLDFKMEFEMVLVKEGGAWKIDLKQTQTEMEKAVEEYMKQFETSE
ncbi:MAG: DUF4878 domain-containing protein [Actinobacteria bacterium]|nr:DUF4878 domain-containing protein [Actinomycetota bacterium]